MRVLWIGDQPPLHLRTRAREAAAQSFAALAADYDISLLSFVSSRHEAMRMRTLAQLCQHVELIPRSQGLPALRLAVMKQLQHGVVDIVHVASPDLLTAVPESWVGPLVVDARPTAWHDIRLASGVDDATEARERRTRAAEYRRASVFVAGSTDERDALESLIGAPWGVHIVPPGVTDAWIDPLRVVAHPSPKRMLSVAGYLGDDEYDDVRLFLRDVFPMIAEVVPEVRYALAGGGSGRRLRRLFGHTPGAVLHIEDESQRLWARAGVFIAPWRSAEMQMPLLQAMGLGIPVVAVPEVCAGLSVLPNKHLLVAETPTRFGEAVIAIQKDRALAARLAEEARRLFEERYSLSAALASFTTVYEHALRRESRCALCS